MEPREGLQVYALACTHGKYYVGCTSNFLLRIQQHINGTGSTWTTQYPPVRVVLLRDCASPAEEDKVTKEYMMVYGIANVRGARYVETVLDEKVVAGLEKDIWTIQGRCLRCGRAGHYVSSCVHTTTVTGRRCGPDTVGSITTQLGVMSLSPQHHETTRVISQVIETAGVGQSPKPKCIRCYRHGHTADKCYAKTTLQGVPLQPSK